MMEDGIKLIGVIKWEAYSGKDGSLIGEGCVTNRIQDACLEGLIDGLDTGTVGDIDSMAIGTGTGQNLATDALVSYASYENSSGSHWTQSQTSATILSTEATFMAGGSWTITEACLATDAYNGSGANTMFTYDDTLSQALSSGDTLKITWTITAA
jgi:hypothetical protein